MLLKLFINLYISIHIISVEGSSRKNERITIFISSHILSELHLIASKYGILNKGKLIKQISTDDLDLECGSYLQIKTSEANKVIEVINNMYIYNYKIQSNGAIDIFDTEYEPEIISSAIINAGASLMSISVIKKDLEEYFLKLIS